MALSQDLRLRIVDLVASGVSRREAARQFKVSASSAIRFVRQAMEVGHVGLKAPKKRKSKLDPYRADMIGWIGKQPDLTLAELCARLLRYMACVPALQRWMTGCVLIRSLIKKTAHASEQERVDVRAKRRCWRKRQDWLKHHLHLLGRIVFIDETGLNTKMARLRGRSAKGQRLIASIPHGHWKTMTFIAGLRHDGMTAPWVLDGPMDGPAFITYIKTQLAPTLQKGDVVVMDNLPAHKVAAANAAIRERGAWLLFLPPYSPDLNPIELAFSKLKAHMKRLAARTVDTLWKGVGEILELFSKQECANFFAASGYGPN